MIKQDNSIEPDLGLPPGINRAGVELVSPILNDVLFGSDSATWRALLGEVLTAIYERGIRYTTNESTGLHIHVALAIRIQDRPWPLDVLKKIATIIVLYEGNLAVRSTYQV